jgi:hypothetical protein
VNEDFAAFLQIETVSEANTASHNHWRERAERAKKQRLVTNLILGPKLRGKGKPTFIELTRFGARLLDKDNLFGAHKAIQDQLAQILGFDDRDEAVLWAYAQQTVIKGAARGTGVRISWRPLERCAHCGQQIMPSA